MKRLAVSAAWAALITTAVAVVVYLGVPRIVGRFGDAGVTDGTTLAGSPTLAEPSVAPASPAPASIPEPSAAALWDPVTEIPGEIDPAELPLRQVEQVSFLASVTYGDSQGATLARDAVTGDWVRADIVRSESYQSPALSPDGRSILRLALRAGVGGLLEVQVVTLATGSVRTLPSPLHGEERFCTIDGAAWAPGSSRVGIVSGCVIDVPGATPSDTWAPGDFETWVDEVDITSGTSRTLEVRPDSSPWEAYPSYSPDGRTFVYGINNGVQPEWETGADAWPAVRAIALDGTVANEWAGMHVGYGDPWRDENTLLVWDEGTAAGSADDYRLLDARSGASTSLGIPRLLNTNGFVEGHLLVDETLWTEPPVPCSVALCLADVSTGRVSPWLTLPGDGRVFNGSAARSLIRPRSS